MKGVIWQRLVVGEAQKVGFVEVIGSESDDFPSAGGDLADIRQGRREEITVGMWRRYEGNGHGPGRYERNRAMLKESSGPTVRSM